MDNNSQLDLNKKLCLAIKDKNLDIVIQLINNGANINSYNGWPLSHAAKQGNIPILQVLIENGLDMQSDETIACLFKNASMYGHIELIKYFINNELNIHCDNEYLLRNSVHHNHLEVVKFLVSHNAVIYDPIGFEDALGACRRLDQLDIVKYFIIDCNQKIEHILNNPYIFEELRQWATLYKNYQDLNNNLSKKDNSHDTKFKI